MIARKTKYFDLPLRMTKRTRIKKDGTVSVWYYYECQRDENGKKKLIPLGKNLNEAKRKWAEIEGRPSIAQNSIEAVHGKYREWAKDKKESGLSDITLKNYAAMWKMLSPVFGRMDINAIKPAHLLRYHHERSSKISGKMEIRYLSMLFDWARLRGYMTTPNPVTGLTRQLSGNSRRNIYVRDQDYELVMQFADRPLQDAMRLAYLTGQRPSDTLNMCWTDIKDNVLTIVQHKTGQTVRIAVTGELEQVINNIRQRTIVGKTLVCNRNGQPIRINTLQTKFARARNLAILYAEKHNLDFQPFQFRDLRAKAASDSDTHSDAQKLLGHKQSSTTAIYRRDKKDVVLPVMSKHRLDMDTKNENKKTVIN